MVIVKYPLLSATAWGKMRGHFAADAPVPPNAHDPALCIYQRRHGRSGLVTVKEKYYRPGNAPSAAQVIRRQRFAAAVRAWQSLDALKRALWSNHGNAKNLPGYQAFLRDYLRGRISR